MSIAIFGGTFDPIHFGHLIIAEQAYNRFKLEKIIFMPAGNPPHKTDNKLTSAELRFQMVELAISDNEHFCCSDWELKHKKISYTVDTLRYYQKNYDKNIYFIIGADSLLDISNWREPEYLLENASFIVARRPSFSLDKVLKKDFFRLYKENIHIMNSILIDISSTIIRKNIKENKSIKYMTPNSIIEFISKNDIYSN